MSQKKSRRRDKPAARSTQTTSSDEKPRAAKSDETTPADDDFDVASPFAVVGIGASAGGLEACKALFHALPADTGMAFVVVQHLAPQHESMLADILARATSMPVAQVVDEPAVEPNHVYVIPPDRNVTILDGRLQLLPRSKSGQNRPVDVFLRALAEARRHAAIGVILSGTANDGTLGLEAIKAQGGITFAQDKSAQQEGMPHSAIASGCVDFVLPPDEIAAEIARIARHPYVFSGADRKFDESSGQTSRFKQVLRLLNDSAGVDFTHYKPNTIYRRIARRMALSKLEGFDDYLKLLRHDEDERDALFHDVLISVTSFFRNPEAFEALKTEVFPRLVKDRSRHEPIRVWVVGCASGEECYSIAMAFAEFAEQSRRQIPMQLFATDLGGRSIEKARAGVYPKSIAQDVSPQRLRRFFVESGDDYRIAKEIRDSCVFARHDGVSDPPFSRIDLVACRNLLIYLDGVLQQKLVAIFHYALRPVGFLWLGASETIGSFRDLFEVEDAKHKIYVKRPGPSRLPIGIGARERDALQRIAEAPARARIDVGLDLQKEADRILIARYAPAGVLVDDSLEVVHFRGDTSPYLVPAPGKASLNLMKMAREGLLVALRSAVQRAKTEGVPVRETGLRVRADGGWREANVEVVPVGGGCFLVLFEDPFAATRPRPTPVAMSSAEGDASGESEERQLQRLTQELSATREYLQSVIEQQEAANEELQSANEEIQSSNEELQSVNEELETSKEEIQSANEELATVNDELQNRNQELALSNNDLVNLIGSVQMPIVMLGRDLRIRRFTPAAEKLLNLIPTDVGRPLTDIKFPIEVAHLEEMLLESIDSVAVKEFEVQDRAKRWHLMRIRPYKTTENKIDGAVLIFVDVDDLKRAQLAVKENEERLRLIVEGAKGYAMMLLDRDGNIAGWNVGAQRLLGWHENEVAKTTFARFYPPQDRPTGRLRETMRRAEGHAGTTSDEWFMKKDGGRIFANVTTAALRDAAGAVRGYSVVVRDVSDRNELEQSLRKRVEELAAADRNKNEFLAMLAHELRNPLAPLRSAVEALAGDPSIASGESVRMIGRHLDHMTRLVDDLLDVARITQGKIELRIAPVDLADVVDQAVHDVKTRTEAREQTVTVSLPSSPVRFDADGARLRQVFANILDNASKFSPQGGRIAVSASLAPGESGEDVVVHVIDHGIGIAENLLPCVFDLFRQGDSSPSRGAGGLGIGLTLVKHLVGLHGGEVEAKSAGPGRGSEFVVRIPYVRADRVPPPAAPLAPGAPRRVLVVDDNVDAAESVAVLLRRDGHEVQVVFDAASALAAAPEFRPDVVILDIGMPGMDGFDAARRLRSMPFTQGAVLVALTGYGQQKDRRRTLDAGFDHHIVKPAKIDDLRRILGRAPSMRS